MEFDPRLVLPFLLEQVTSGGAAEGARTAMTLAHTTAMGRRLALSWHFEGLSLLMLMTCPALRARRGVASNSGSQGRCFSGPGVAGTGGG